MKVKILPKDAAPPAGLVPIADRALDQLVTQASNDNIPLIDFGLAPPAGDSTPSGASAQARITPGSSFPAEAI